MSNKVISTIWFFALILLSSCESDDVSTTNSEEVPLILQGRQWDDGAYYTYGGSEFYTNDVTDDLEVKGDSVLLKFTETGYIWKFSYENDTLIAMGGAYEDIRNNPSPKPGYENRKMSGGFIFDFKDTTFLGYSNWQKIVGNPTEIEGTYRKYLIYEYSTMPDPVFTIDDLDISYSTLDQDSLDLTYASYRRKGFSPGDPIIFDTTYSFRKIPAAVMKNELLFLVEFNGSEYLYSRLGGRVYPGPTFYLR